IPSTTSICESVSAPPPPYSSGKATPRKPSSPSWATIWRGKVSSLSQRAACGLISRSANSASVVRICCCSSVRSKFIDDYPRGRSLARLVYCLADYRRQRSLARLDLLAHPLDDILGRGAGRKDLAHTERFELGRVLVGNDSAAEHRDVAGALFLEQPDHFGEQRHMRARQDTQADRVDVLLHGG